MLVIVIGSHLEKLLKSPHCFQFRHQHESQVNLMVTVYDVPADKLIERLAEELRKFEEIKPPEWAKYVKTGVHKERPPQVEDWWYVRAASVLRKVYMRYPIGVSRLAALYGGKRRRGVKPPHARKGSRSIARKILQQLEAAGLVITTSRGRIISPKGQSLLDRIAKEVAVEVAKRMPEIKLYY